MRGLGFPGSTNGKEPVCQCRRHRRQRIEPWVGKIPWRRAQQPTSVFLLENPRTEEPGRLPSIGWQRVGHDWSDFTCMHALQRSGWGSLFFFLLICLQTWSPLFSSTPIPSFIRPCLSTFSHVRPPKPGSCTDMCRISACLNPFCHIFRNKTISNLWFLFSTRAWIIYPLILNI